MNSGFLSVEDEADLVRQWQVHKSVAARDRILLAFRPLCEKVVRRLERDTSLHEDLCQDAVFGLVKALDRFDLDRGYRLGTYAAWWVRAEVQEAVLMRAAGSAGMTGAARKVLVMLPRARALAISRIRRAGGSEDEGQIRKEMAKLIRVTEDTISDLESLRKVLSLNFPVEGEGEGGIDLIDTIQGAILDGESQLIETQRESMNQKAVDDLLEKLTEREADVLRRRIYCEGKGQSLSEIGGQYGLTRERIRQIEHAALAKLKKIVCQTNLKEQLSL